MSLNNVLILLFPDVQSLSADFQLEEVGISPFILPPTITFLSFLLPFCGYIISVVTLTGSIDTIMIL